MTDTTGPVLITGCSSGIGAATARRLLADGHTVYATARKPETLDELADAGAHVLALDVTSEESMAAAVSTILGEHGRIGALVNNAGYGAYGAIEDVPITRVRDQFETNVFGMARLTQLVLPSMRAHGSGRVVMMSSMGGRLTFPFGGYYHASKHAVEAFSDALRYEVKPFGVKVSIIEPGLITTRFGETAAGTMSSATPGDSPYTASVEAVDTAMSRSYRNKALTAGTDAVAKAVAHAVSARRPRTRYVITRAARALVTTRAVAPGPVWDRVVGATFGV
jgi:NAD(P)-dependent dehydrogenase (short-subunit alcohol dehydrogenase family)